MSMKSAPAKGPRGGGPGMWHGGFGVVAKPNNFKSSLKRLIKEIQSDGRKIYLVLTLLVISVVTGLIGPKIIGHATNLIIYGFIGSKLPAGIPKAQLILRAHNSFGAFANIINSPDVIPGSGVNFSKVFHYLLIVGILYILSSLLSWWQLYTMAGITQRTVFRLRLKCEEKISKVPLSYFDTGSRGDILSRVTNDLDNLGMSIQQSFSQTLNSLLTVLVILGIMFWISPYLALISLIAIPLSVIISIRIGKRSQKEFGAQWSWIGKLNGHIEEMLTGHSLVRVFGHRQKALADFNELNESVYKTSFKAQFISGIIQPATTLITNAIYVLIAVVGGWFVVNGSITIGDVQAFIQYSRQFSFPLAQLAGLVNTIQSGVASAERVFEFLDAPEEVIDQPKAQITRAKGEVVFDQVSFRYKEDIPLIENLNLKVKPGQTIAIVGPTGAGKTTLVNLMMRFYELNSGKILIDGIDAKDLSRDQLRKQFGMVLQDTWLFTGTMAENIAFGADNPSRAQIEEAAKAANIDHFLRSLPEGYDSLLTDDSAAISNGERQLLTIARAFIADPPILILDEATSSVDTRTEVLVQKAMARLRQGRTSFVIAHRLSTIVDADVILVMNNGSLIEQGSHQELMAKHGFYYDLYEAQFASALE